MLSPNPAIPETMRPGEVVAYSQLIVLAQDEELLLRSGLVEATPLPDVDAGPPGAVPATPPQETPGPAAETRINRQLLALGAGLGLLSGGTAVLALNQDQNMQDADNQSTLDRAFLVQKILAGTSYTALGFSVVTISASFVF